MQSSHCPAPPLAEDNIDSHLFNAGDHTSPTRNFDLAGKSPVTPCCRIPPPPHFVTVQLDDLDDQTDEPEPCSDIDSGPPIPTPNPKRHWSSCQSLTDVQVQPFKFEHSLHRRLSALKLTSPPSLLSLVGGGRILYLDCWDRMPYSATAALVHAHTPPEDDAPDFRTSGKSTPNPMSFEQMSTIFVHPPTPDRELAASPATEASSVSKADLKTSSQDATRSISSQVATRAVPVSNNSPPTPSKSKVGMHVLPEVRSPPKQMISLAAERLKVQQRRGRRPGMFGFTEMPSSSGSSAASSRASSPVRAPPTIALPPAQPTPLASRESVLPRRSSIRARSDTNLPVLASTSRSSVRPPRRKLENGLRLDFTGIIPVDPVDEPKSASVASPSLLSNLIRKKSGEILKSALKYNGPLAANGTPLDGPKTDSGPSTPRSALFESKSCPTTPSCPKYVHFDAQLEHVKLFLHDQKPEVVSRSGSPSVEYTTSEGEEYPFPPTDTESEREDKRVLQIKLPNFPTSHLPDSELYLESLFLDDDRKALRGIIVCKNIAFQKWVAVRFTTDFWQTTSEVSASHKDSVKGGDYDRFQFVIKLADMLSRIEEKTMFLAIRFNTDGRELWDSNGGQNYQVLFEKARLPDPDSVPRRNSATIQPGMGRAIGGRTSQWSVTDGNADDRLADLRAKLSRLTAEDDEANRPLLISPNRDRSFSFRPPRRNVKGSTPAASSKVSFSAQDPAKSDLPSAGGTLAARYDFGSALKTARQSSSPVGQKAELPDVQTGYRKVNTHASNEFYTPKFNSVPNGDPTSPTGTFFSSTADTRGLAKNQANQTSIGATGVTESWMMGSTIAGMSRPGISRSNTDSVLSLAPVVSASVPPLTTTVPLTTGRASTERDSPPGLVRQSSVDTLPGDSPQSPPDVIPPRFSPTNSGFKPETMSAHYSSLLEQFCWGGGSGIPLAPETDELPRRVHSTSSLDAYFAESRMGSPPVWGAVPAANSGSQTPKPSTFALPSTTFFSSGATELGDGPDPSRTSPRLVGLRREGLEIGRMSPSIVC